MDALKDIYVTTSGGRVFVDKNKFMKSEEFKKQVKELIGSSAYLEAKRKYAKRTTSAR